MFKIYLNDECFYDDRMEQRSITGLKLTLEENKAGSMEFTIYPDHPYYSAFEKITSTILVKQNDVIIFRGRVLDSEESFYKERKITCEGEYAFFNDGIFYPIGSEPVDETETEEGKAGTRYTPIEIFTQILTDYNSQVEENRKFIIGNISITNSTEKIDYWNLEFMKSIEALDDLIERCGGHFIFRHEDEGIYIDWTDNYDSINQDVSFGINLLDLTQKIQGDEVITAILPYGDEDERTNLPTNISTTQIPSTVLHRQMVKVEDAIDNSRSAMFGEYGICLVNIPLYEKYGLIIEERSYDGYPNDWKDQLIADVDSLTGLSNSIEITAVDMSSLNDVDFFQIGKKVDVISDKHGIKDSYNITKLELNLQNPASNKFTLGKVIPNFIEQVIQGDKVKPIDGQSIKITGYEWAYAISDNGTVVPDDSLFSESYTPEQGKWIWTRVTTKYNDGTETKIYYPSYLGKDAKQFKIKADSTVIVKNDRRSDAQTITFKADISGYPNAIPLWYINGEKVGEGSTYIRPVPYKNAEGFSINLYDGSTLMDTLNLTVVDKTGGSLYLGPCESAVPTQTPNGEALIEGDYFLCTKSFDSYVAGNPYRWNGTMFVSIIRGENVTDDEWAKIMNGCLDDAILTEQEIDTRFFSFFKTLATKEGFFRFLTVYRLLIGNGTPSSGLYFVIASVDENGNPLGSPIFKCLYNGVNLFSIDFSVPQVIIGDYFNKGGVLWDGNKQELTINGSGRFSGLLDTVTIKTSNEGNTNYSYGDIADFDDFINLVSLANLIPNSTVPLSGTINGKSITEMTIGNITTTQGRKRFYEHTWMSSWGFLVSFKVGNLPIVIKDVDGGTYQYMVRKEYVYGNNDAWNNTTNYPPYPETITDLKELLSLHDFSIKANNFDSDWGTSSEFCSESDFDDYGSAKLFPYTIVNAGYYDSITERLYIYNLPTLEPADSNRVWVDSDGYLHITS